MGTVRPAAVAGSFYPGDPGRLRDLVERLLAEAGSRAAPERAPKAIIAPHAGYVYSGPIAASAFAALAGGAERIERVVLLGPSHFVPLTGLALPAADALETPLGQVAIDRAGAAVAAKLPGVVRDAGPHLREHSLEVELPFLQVLLGEFKVVPLAVGEVQPGEVGAVLADLWGGPETVIVVSSDLSHYLTHAAARAADQDTAAAILGLNYPLPPSRACGSAPVNGLLFAARARGLRPRLLDLRNSGDTAGDRSRVVGYGAFAFDEARADA